MILFIFLLSLNCLTVCSEENSSINSSFDALPDEVLVIIGKLAINSKTPQHNITRCNTKFYKLIFPEFIENFIKVARPKIFTSNIEFLHTHFTNKVPDDSEDFIIKKKDKQYMFDVFNLEQLLKNDNFNSIVRIVVHQKTRFDELFKEINKNSFKNFTPNKQKKLQQLFLSSHHELLFSQNTEKLKLLLQSGVNPNIKDYDGNTVLHLAVSWQNKDIVELLLQYGANPDIKDNYGETVLHRAVRSETEDIIELLLQYGLNPNIKDDHWNGNTGLHLAVTYGNKDMVKLLLQYGANPNIQNNNGETALHVAIAKNMNYYDIVTLLLEHKANPNIKSNYGETALHWAVRSNTKI